MKISVVGANGRMGQEILKAIESRKATASVGITRKNKAIGFPNSATEFSKEVAEQTDVLIDFSSLENIKEVCQFCRTYKVPLVVGTTGLKEKDFEVLKEAAKSTALLWSPNMSLGISAVREAIKVLSHLPGFDFQIEEIHHNKKKDKPSGTALYLQKALEEDTKKKWPEPVALRGGGVFGVHKIYAFSENEVICFEHQALNRQVFAVGAVEAAVWLAGQKPGFYEMKDYLRGTKLG